MILHNTVKRVGASNFRVLDGLGQQHNTLLHDVHQIFSIKVGVVKVGKQVAAVILVLSMCVLESSGKRANLLFLVLNSGML